MELLCGNGCDQSIIRDIAFDGVKVRIKNGPLQESYGGNFDLRGCRDVATAIFAHDIPAFYCRYADGVKIAGLEVEWADDLPAFFSNAIQVEDFKNVDIDGFNGCRPAHGNGGKDRQSTWPGEALEFQFAIRAPREARATLACFLP